MFYIIQFFILTFYTIITYGRAKGPRKVSERGRDIIYLVISGIHLSAVAGCRGASVGTDTLSYLRIYRMIEKYNYVNFFRFLGYHETFSKAPLWTAIFRVITRVVKDFPQMYVIFSSVFIIVTFWTAIYLSKVHCGEAVTLFYLLFFSMSLNGARCFMAIGLVTIGYIMLESRHKRLGISLFIAAVLIHNTAIISIVMVVSSYVDFSNGNRRRAYEAVMLAIVPFYSLFIEVFIRLFPVYAMTLEVVQDQVSGKNLATQIMYLLAILQAWNIKREKTEDGTSVINIRRANFYLMFEVVMGIFGYKLWFMQRILPYFQAILLFQFPEAFRHRSRYRKIYFLVIYLASFAFLVYRLYRNLGDSNPYIPFWK